MAAQQPGGILNPYMMMRDAQGWIQTNWMLLAVLAVLIGIIAAWLLFSFWSEFNSLSARERSFKRGRSSISQTIRVELLERMKRKKKRPF